MNIKTTFGVAKRLISFVENAIRPKKLAGSPWNRSFIFGLEVFVLISGVGCSGGKGQDPLKDQPTNVRKGIPPEDKPKEDRQPIPREAMRLEITPSLPTFVEGQEGQLTIKGSILGLSQDEFDISIENLPKGASFDPVANRISWTPAKDMVKGESYTSIYNLKVQMSTRRTPVLSVLREFVLYVQRDMVRPEILRVESPDQLSEGEQYKMWVTVKDLDSADDVSLFGSVQAPHLMVVRSPNSFHDGSHLITLDSPRWDLVNPRRMDRYDPQYDPSIWIYQLTIDTRYKELTSSRDVYGFGLIAVSRFGLASAEGNIPSTPKIIELPIVTRVPKALTTWPDDIIEFKEGEKTVFSFDVYAPISQVGFRSEPQGDGILDPVEIKANCHQDLPGDAECRCIKANSWRYNCTMSWLPPLTTNPTLDSDGTPLGSKAISLAPALPLVYPVAFRVTNRSLFGSRNTEVSEFVKKVSIVK